MNARGLLLSGLLLTHIASAGVTVKYHRGTAGLKAFSVTVNNQGLLTLACQATTAHWYSVELGTLAPDATLSTRLWKNPATGEVFILNQHQDRLPLQRVWCGIAGDAWRTRADVALPTRRGPGVASILLRCVAGVDKIDCRAADAPHTRDPHP
ncbi:hypothetical protein JZM24_12525 [Candidatus Sodalis endolongispinus]|uniref:Uncharacterized protein n=1 Tax=Candidatus Sodalis endolongispinus TaxID=2812662 RepID=A0ABS5YCK3_9GAMM|nr:hypothetical protein [Candidatus Sodalis endolongispinus]MBT9432744.1 hypothetical protein [Candidatus Sodalis endolongispinus]